MFNKILTIIVIVIIINTLSSVRAAKDMFSLNASVTEYLESPLLQEVFPDYLQETARANLVHVVGTPSLSCSHSDTQPLPRNQGYPFPALFKVSVLLLQTSMPMHGSADLSWRPEQH